MCRSAMLISIAVPRPEAEYLKYRLSYAQQAWELSTRTQHQPLQLVCDAGGMVALWAHTAEVKSWHLIFLSPISCFSGQDFSGPAGRSELLYVGTAEMKVLR